MNTIKHRYTSQSGNTPPPVNYVKFFANNDAMHNWGVAYECLRLTYGMTIDITQKERDLLLELSNIMEKDRKIFKGKKRNYITEAKCKETNDRIDIVTDNPFEEIEICNKNDKKEVLEKYKKLGRTCIKV